MSLPHARRQLVQAHVPAKYLVPLARSHHFSSFGFAGEPELEGTIRLEYGEESFAEASLGGVILRLTPLQWQNAGSCCSLLGGWAVSPVLAAAFL